MATAKLLLVIVNETDRWQDAPLYEAVVQRLRHLGIVGATAQAGIMGFGRHHRVHHKRLFGVSDDRPITIMAFDADAKLRAAVPEVRRMVADGVVALVDAELIE